MKHYLCPTCKEPCALWLGFPDSDVVCCTNNAKHPSGLSYFVPLSAWPPHLIVEVPKPWRARTKDELIVACEQGQGTLTYSRALIDTTREDCARMLEERAKCYRGVDGVTEAELLNRAAEIRGMR